MTADELGRRIKAALVLADRTPEDVAPELNISGRTLNRVIAGERQPREWELGRLAEVLAVPVWFFTDGLAPPPASEEEDLRRDLQAIDSKIDTVVVGRLDGIENEIRALHRALTSGRSDRSPDG